MHSGYEQISYGDPGIPFSYIINRQLTAPLIEKLHVPRWHEQLELKLILSGKAEISCGTDVFVVGPGDIVIVNMCELHAMRAIGDESVAYHLLDISPNVLYAENINKRMLPAFNGNIRFENHIIGDETCHALFTSMFEALALQKDAYVLTAIGYFSLLFGTLLQSHTVGTIQSAEQENVRRYAQTLEPALLMIAERYKEPLTLEVLADACGKSVYHFSHIFKSVTGKTAVTYLNEYRLNKAALLIRSTDMSVRTVAEMVGINDYNYFTRIFKRIKGITPTECRQEMKKTESYNHSES